MLPDKFAYLSLALLYMVAWTVVFIKSPYKQGMLKVCAVGGLMGVVAEVWYFRDYWRPPTLFGQGIPGIEDYIIGFAMFGVGGYVYSSFTKRKMDLTRKTPAKYRNFFWLFIAGVSSMTIFSIGFNIHSGYVTFLTFFLLSVYIWIQRPDLIGVSLISAVVVGVISFTIYYINFNLLFPHFWDDYGMLDEDPFLGYRLANIPLSEMIWHTTWGMLCSMFRGYRNGVYYK